MKKYNICFNTHNIQHKFAVKALKLICGDVIEGFVSTNRHDDCTLSHGASVCLSLYNSLNLETSTKTTLLISEHHLDALEKIVVAQLKNQANMILDENDPTVLASFGPLADDMSNMMLLLGIVHEAWKDEANN